MDGWEEGKGRKAKPAASIERRGRRPSVRIDSTPTLRSFPSSLPLLNLPPPKMSTKPSACLLFVRRVTRAFMLSQGHDAATISALSITSARPGSIQARLKIGSHNVNRLGSVHGGLVCTLTDTMGSLALASKGLYSTGVSTDIHTTFSRPAGKPGDEVDIVGEVVSLGEHARRS